MTALPPPDPAAAGEDTDPPIAESAVDAPLRSDPRLAAPVSRRAWRMQILTTGVFTTAVLTALLLWAQAV